MSLTPSTIKNSFIQLSPSVGANACTAPQVCLPVVNGSDLAFQMTFLATEVDFNFMMQTPEVEFYASADNSIFITVGAIVNGYLTVGASVTGAGIPPGTIIMAQLSGLPGNTGIYGLNNAITVVNGTLLTATYMLGKMGATILLPGEVPPSSQPLYNMVWVATAAAPTGRTINSVPEWVMYFQYNSSETRFASIPTGTCFQLEFLYMVYNDAELPTAWNFVETFKIPYGQNTTTLITDTCFKKIDDSCDSYPTSVLQYANNSDAFGFYYDALGQLVDSINFLNSIRLPIYLHSPEQAEDQMNYQKSDGSTLKLSHRIWTDYKLKTDYLTADMHRALVAATAHDWVFITCPVADLNPWIDDDGNAVDYTFPFTPTQFVRAEKIEVEWQQETMPRYKLGQAKGTLRLALAASNVNTNCG